MKQQIYYYLLVLLMSMTGIKATAHDIEVANSDGVTIYYEWANNRTELAVSYRGSDYDSYENEYTGSVVIPKSVSYNGKNYPVMGIGYVAFCYCSSLTSVSIPNSASYIGDWAFGYCTALTNVTIPNSVTSIGGSAFEDCSSLTSVTIPNSVTSIGDAAFNSTAIYNNAPDGVFYVDKWVCGYKGTMPANTAITLAEGTRGISDFAFYYCHGLTSVTIPNSVTSIGDDAFFDCRSLTSVDIPSSMTSIGIDAFAHCSSLMSVTIPNSVTSIGDWAFARCI